MLIELFDLHRQSCNYDDQQQINEIGDQILEWKVSARWFKYEEDVEGVDHFWGRPHVSFLLLKSFYHFKQLFGKGLVILDPLVTNFDELNRFLRKTFETELSLDKKTATFLVNLLSEKKIRYSGSNLLTKVSSKLSFVRNPSLSEIRRKISTTSLSRPTSPNNLSFVDVHSSSPHNKSHPPSVKFSLPGLPIPSTKSQQTAPPGHHHPSLQLAHSLVVGSCSRKSSNENFLSDESDFVTTEIFVADIPRKFLREELFLMLRLPNPSFMPELTGQSGLLHFLVLFVGPTDGCPKERHEMGRVMATLMADKNFHRLTLLASKKEDLAEGIDHFLGCSTLIPPGKIDDRSLFSPENLPTPSETMSAKRKSNFSSKISEISELKSELLNHNVTETSANSFEKKRKIGVSPIDRIGESPFDKTGRSFGGLVRDFKNRLPFYVDDFASAFNFQCLTSILFIFFANFAVAVAMGEALSEKTNGLMGVTEVLVSHAISGTTWALFSGQPLCIVAAVGPFLVFESSLCQFCNSINLDYLSVRFWTGLWTFGFMLLMAMIEAPTVMRYLTRFTEDIYTSFIAAIFVWEGGKFVYDEFRSHPLSHLDTYCEKSSFNCSSMNATFANLNESVFRARKWQNNVRLADQPDTAFLSLILFVVTFLLAFGLKRLRTSIYCGRTIRRSLGDFGVPLAVVIISFVDIFIFQKTYTRHVNIKPSFDLTSPEKRGWFVRPFGTRRQPLPLYMLFASMIPAFLASVIIFAQTEIVEILLSKEERRLRKPGGFHLDLVVNGVVVLIASVLGVQWLTPAAVQSLSHAASLTVMKRAAPGETPEIDYVIEQRVTLLVIALLHGAAAFVGNILVLIPTATLFGLFLYLGVMGLLSTQLWHRMVLYFVPHKYFPNDGYCKDVKMRRMHYYTTIQLACFSCLWVVKMFSSASMAFPFVLVTIAGFRKYFMGRIFFKEELFSLEGVQQNRRQNYEETAKDFYDEVDDDKVV